MNNEQNHFRKNLINFYLLILFLIPISYSFRTVLDSSNFLPFYDETHSYFLPGVNYFKNSLYKVLDKEKFQQTFGQPPIHQILINIMNQISQNNPEYLRLNYYLLNIFMLMLIVFLLMYQTQSILIATLFLFFTVFNFKF